MTEERRDELTEDLPEIARHTSERERRADDAERELVQWKKVRFMADKVGDEFDGYVTGVSAFGLYIELVEHFVEGMVHVSTMADDYYRFVERAHILRGENKGRVYRLGDRVRVQVDQGRHRAAADRPRPGRDPRRRARVRAQPRAAAAAARRSRRAKPARAAGGPGGARQEAAARQEGTRRRAGSGERRARTSSSARPGTSITARARSSAR